jgi:UDP-N-acetylglucosamine diphosphorylase/glucosamine-1-phosphate N-acetyltransferase
VARPGLILFDDLQAQRWAPFALTRPVGELLFGAEKLAERAGRVLGLDVVGYLTSKHLLEFSEAGAPSVLGLDRLPERGTLFWCSRAVPESSLEEVEAEKGPVVYLIDERPVGLYLPDGQRVDQVFLDELRPGSAPGARVTVRGRLLEWPWDLLAGCPEQLARDLAGAEAAAELPKGVHREGKHEVILAADVRIEPGVLFDTREGPIRLGDGVEVRTGTRLAGPTAIGEGSRLLGGSFERIVAGPHSYLQGEMTDCVVLGYTNKAHQGYLGHSYVGKWVNLGALTTNSDLKNNYRPVRVWTPVGVLDSGSLKIGCFLGDHVKTGIGLLLGTGTVVGAGSNLYGTAMPPRYVEPFSWGEGADLGEYRLAEFLDTAEHSMARRGVELGERGRRFLESCWRKGRGG